MRRDAEDFDTPTHRALRETVCSYENAEQTMVAGAVCALLALGMLLIYTPALQVLVVALGGGALMAHGITRRRTALTRARTLRDALPFRGSEQGRD